MGSRSQDPHLERLLRDPDTLETLRQLPTVATDTGRTFFVSTNAVTPSQGQVTVRDFPASVSQWMHEQERGGSSSEGERKYAGNYMTFGCDLEGVAGGSGFVTVKEEPDSDLEFDWEQLL